MQNAAKTRTDVDNDRDAVLYRVMGKLAVVEAVLEPGRPTDEQLFGIEQIIIETVDELKTLVNH